MAFEHKKSILLFACFVSVLILLSAWFTERNGGVDEPGLLNPPYMLKEYGVLTFPASAYGGLHDIPVVIHPPMHVGWIGLLWRMGIPPYYAEATPTAILFLLAILIVVYSGFPAPVKLGWLFAIGFLASSGDTLTLCFGTRPEGEVHATWFCGLLLLESGRLANWNLRRLFAGAFLLTWAAGTHYYAGPALLGVVVYMLWARRSLSPDEVRRPVLAMIAGGCLYGIPYLAFYILPYYNDIHRAISGSQGSGGIALSIERHMAMYKDWVQELYRPPFIRKAMSLGIPFWIVSTALLAAVRSTRGIALASLPLQLGLFFFAWHKMPYYFVHESVLLIAALAIALLVLGQNLITRYLPKQSQFYVPAAAAALGFLLVYGSPMLAQANFSLQQRFHEIEVAQAAGRRIMGPNARIGGHWWSWHAAGAAHWFDIEHDLSLKATLLDPDTYLSNLDALEISYEPDAQSIVNDWYAEGKLHLRGFFFGQSNVHLRTLQLSPGPKAPLLGYAVRNDQLYRFNEDAAGDHEVLSAICAVGAREDWNNPRAGQFSAALGLPPDSAGRAMWLVTVLAPRADMAPAGSVGQGCSAIARTRGTFVADDRRALVEWARHNDAPIHFYRDVDEMPGYRGVGLPPEAIPPAGAVRVENIIDLKGISATNDARLERTSVFRVTTVRAPGGFSAIIPVRNAETIAGPCWVVLRIRVIRGRVGFGAGVEGGGLIATTPGIAPSPEPQTVALKVPDFRAVRSIIVFNQQLYAGQADILDAAVMVSPPGNEGPH
ncbi:MAG: hypothetical protein ABI806_05270 [Candidatus Solibacter sp.]